MLLSPPPSPPPPPPSARTTPKPAGQSAYQQFLSVVRKALYRVPFSFRGVSSAVRAFSRCSILNKLQR